MLEEEDNDIENGGGGGEEEFGGGGGLIWDYEEQNLEKSESFKEDENEDG